VLTGCTGTNMLSIVALLQETVEHRQRSQVVIVEVRCLAGFLLLSIRGSSVLMSQVLFKTLGLRSFSEQRGRWIA